MKPQILFIHGGTAFSKYENFLNSLKTLSIDDPLGLDPHKRWHASLSVDLGDTYEVYKPSMPNRQNAKYEEWKIWFERYLGFLRDGTIYIGHSQGGYFLTKYLTENTISLAIKAVYLLAAPFEPDNFEGEDGGDFAYDTSKLSNLEKQVEEIFIFHSKDDPVVPYAHAKKYKKALPEAKLITFEDRGHFLMEEFPELIQSIQSL